MILEITNNIDKIIEACKLHYIKSFYVFGSATTANFNTKSDIDFLYEEFLKLADLHKEIKEENLLQLAKQYQSTEHSIA